MDEKYTVCIGRQYGSGGREVGALVAEKLGITCSQDVDKIGIAKWLR